MSDSIDQLRQSLATDPENWSLRRQLAEQLYGAGQGEEAAAQIADTPVVPPTEADMQFAVELLAAIDPAHAAGFADQVLEVDGDNPAAHVGKAFACLLAGDADTAEAWYQQAQGLQSGYRSEAFETMRDDLAAVGGAAVQDDEAPVVVAPMQGPPAAAVVPAPSIPVPSAAMVPPPSIPAPSVAVPSPTVARAPLAGVPAPSAGRAVALPLAAVAAPQPELTEEEKAALAAAEEDAHLAEVIAHAARNKDTTEKATAFTVALVIHIAILALLTLIILAPALLPAPEIVAVTAPVTSQTELQNRQVAPVVQKTPAAPSAPTTQIINAAGPSQVSISSVDFAPETDTIDFGSSFGSGFSAGGAGATMGGAGVPFAMKSRCSRPERIELLQKHGGTVQVENAVDKSLNWLQGRQNSNGSWGNGSYSSAMTGLALLCYLGRCETPDSPKYGDTVMNGIMYLVELSLQNDGLFTANPANRHYPYEHGIATYALGETYAMARMGNRRLPGVREAFERGVEIIIDGQNRDGGWVYAYTGEGHGDTSVTGWQYQALRAAMTTQLQFSGLNRAVRRTREYLEGVQGAQGAFGYRSREDKPTLAGLGALGLQMMGRPNAASTRKAIGFIQQQPALTWDNIQIYVWYYNTQAMFNAGGDAWDHWNKQMLPILLEKQNEDGSWPRDSASGGVSSSPAGGDWQIYITAMNTLMLEIYYRYLPAGSDTDSFDIFND